ncbi:hypothetical protein OEZ86_009260 [Tetradesmus obliquus]|nr:hypothetical protein OEZ86_009260 [Tetradesmus obliquus]
MILSKARTKAVVKDQTAKQEKRPPTLDELLDARDYVGAITLLNFKRQGNRNDTKLVEWLAYAHYHHGEHDKALALYQELLHQDDPDPLYHTYSAACYYYMGLTQEAAEAAAKGPRCPLATRIQFHCAHKRGDEDALMALHSSLGDSLEDQLSLAALHFNRGHHQEAMDIYKGLLLDHRELLALNMRFCRCTSTPEATGGSHTQHDLIRHNLVVFKGGEGALQVLPGLNGVLPEASLNLVIHHLRRGELGEAHALVKDLEPSTPQEYILKAVVAVSLSQASGSQEQLAAAQQHFRVVGSSASECDTIPGRQAMASCFFLMKLFEDVLVFLNSIRSYFASDDDFNWNYGLALAATGKYREAEEALGAVQSDKYRSEPTYVSWLARCLIMSGKAAAAWQLYQTAQETGSPAAAGEEGYALLQLIANDCYKMGAFYYAIKAFDVLERLDPNPEFYDAKRGAAVGVFQAIIAGKGQPELLPEVVELLQNSAAASHDGRQGSNALQIEQITRVMQQWGQVNGIMV